MRGNRRDRGRAARFHHYYDHTHRADYAVEHASADGGGFPTGNILVVADTANNRVAHLEIHSDGERAAGRYRFGADQLHYGGPGCGDRQRAARPAGGVDFQGSKLFVADTQNNRILIWNSIPTKNNQPADLVLGQPDFVTSPPINQVNLTPNRVLVYDSIPQKNAVKADVVLGEPDEFSDVFTSSDPTTVSTADVLPTPTSLAWDPVNQNLYVADATDFRILIFSPQQPTLDPSAPSTPLARASVCRGGGDYAGRHHGGE